MEPVGFATSAIYAAVALVHTVTWALASTCQVIRPGITLAVVFPADLGVPPLLLVTRSMGDHPATDRRN